MRYFALIILCLAKLEISYSQDDFLKKTGITAKNILVFCDSANQKYSRLGYQSETWFDKNINLGQGEFYRVNNDSCFVYDMPNIYSANKIATLRFSDSVYVFRDIYGKSISIYMAGELFDHTYYLCSLNDGRIGLFDNDDCISTNSLLLSPNENYYLTTNGLSKLLVSLDWKKFVKFQTPKLLWFPDKYQVLYNDCYLSCDTNSRILRFDLRSWKNDLLLKGVSPLFVENSNAIMYFGDSVINGLKRECLFKHSLITGTTELFYQIPDTLTYWHNGDDFTTPCEIKLNQVRGKTEFELNLWRKGSDYNGNTYLYYVDEQKKVVQIRRI